MKDVNRKYCVAMQSSYVYTENVRSDISTFKVFLMSQKAARVVSDVLVKLSVMCPCTDVTPAGLLSSRCSLETAPVSASPGTAGKQ